MARPARTPQHGNDESNLVAFSANLPASPEAERNLLGIIFTEVTAGYADAPSLRAAIADQIGPRHFQTPAHRLIFQAMRSLLQANLPPDPAGVWQAIASDHGEVSPEVRAGVLALSGANGISSLHARAAIDALKKTEAERVQIRAADDLALAIRAGDEERVREARNAILTAGQEDRAGLPRITSAADLVARECPTPAVLLGGLLHRGGKLLLGGGAKSFKSWCLIDLAVSVAAGTEFWSIPTTQARVLYLNFEIAEPFFRGRLMAIAKAKNLNFVETGKALDIWTLRGHAADLRQLVPHIIAQAAGRNYGLIILDPIYKCLGDRDENAAGDIGELLNEVETLACKTGAAVAIAHHFAKGNSASKESKDRVSGSGVWARDPDALVTITPHEEDGAFTIESTLRNFAPKPAFAVRWQWPLMRAAEDLDPAQLKQAAGGRPKENTADTLLALLPPQGASFSAWLTLAKGVGITESTFKRLLRVLRDENQITSLNGLNCRTGRKGGES